MRLTVALALAAFPAPVLAQGGISGAASVTDGDSLTIGSVSIRLFGIDAPEGKQTCQREGATWACGEEAASQLRSLTAGQQVQCESRGTDQYGRTLAVCTAGGFELNRTMVEYGWATAYHQYSEDYAGVEARAKAAKLGIWSSEFDQPEAWRMAHHPGPRDARTARAGAAAQPRSINGNAGGCVVKGNRNRKGQWIYHLPGMPYYDATRAEETFCSEAAARAAGYRRAIVR